MEEYNENNNSSNSQNKNNIQNNYSNINEKPLHGPISNSINVAGSNNPMQDENINVSNSIFSSLHQSGDVKILKKSNEDEIRDIYSNLSSKYKYVICILIKDDTCFNSDLLDKTFTELINNIKTLNVLLINPENVLICLFFNQINNSSIFSKEELNQLTDESNFILSPKSYSIESGNIDVHCISKKDYLSDIEILHFYYSYIINQLVNNNIIFSSTITAGVIPNTNSLETLIKVSYNTRNTHSIVVPSLDEFDDNALMTKIKKYERVHYNLYNMNFYSTTASVPISTLFNTMTIDSKLSQDLKIFYLDIKFDGSIDYHDYNLSLYLFRKNHKITYYNYQSLGIVKYSDLKDDPISDYKNYWVKRYSGYYGNFFSIVNTFLDFDACNVPSKFFLFFQILGLMIEFIYPSLSCMVIYTIFNEAFGGKDIRPSAFCTLLYLFIFTCSGVCSLINKNSQKIRRTNIFFYFFMEAYYLIILICAIAAMDKVNKNKTGDPYKFNTAALVCIILFTLIPAICPMIIKNSVIIENIVPTLLYLVLGAPSSTSTFNIAKVVNSSDASGGGVYIKEKKGILIIVYLLSNLFFGSLTFYNYNRQKRVDAVMGLGIFYLLYNFFKTIAIVINLMTNNQFKTNNDQEIRNFESNNISDIKKSSQMNNNSVNNYQSNNQELQNSQMNYDEPNNNNQEEQEQEYPSKGEIDKNNYYGDNDGN